MPIKNKKDENCDSGQESVSYRNLYFLYFIKLIKITITFILKEHCCYDKYVLSLG